MAIYNLSNLVSPNEAAKLMEYSEGTVKNKCANGELLCTKVGKQWILDRTYLKELRKVEFWTDYDGTTHSINVDEIDTYVLPEADPETYFKLNMLDLHDKFGEPKDIDLEDFKISDVDWDRAIFEPSEYIEENIYVLKSEYTNEFAKENGYKNLDEIYPEEYRAFTYYDDMLTLHYLWESDMESVIAASITKRLVTLDEYKSKDAYVTGGMGEHQDVFRIVIEDNEQVSDQFVVINMSDWSGQYPTVKFKGNLAEIMEYREELNDRLCRASETSDEEFENQLMDL